MFTDRSRLANSDAHEIALDCLAAGIEAAAPRRVVEESIAYDPDDNRLTIPGERTASGDEGESGYDLDRIDRIVLLGGGKAAAGVAAAVEEILGDRLDDGVVVTSAPGETDRVEVVEGDHPTPSERNVAATERVLERAARADERTLVLAAVTGGASALWCAPADDLSLTDLRRTTDALLESGASIDEINAVRKHCSAIKGGRLAMVAAPATVVALALSDVVGDDPAVIGSGPTVPDSSTYGDALSVLDRYDLREAVPESVVDRLQRGAAGELAETPEADDRPFADPDATIEYHLLASGRTAIDAARELARERGYEPIVLTSRLEGEAREAGRFHASIAAESRDRGDPIEPPAAILSGGEVTVTVRGDGTGGPNQELALAAAIDLAADGIETVLASVDTDGIDGASDAAGAIVDSGTVTNESEARGALDRNDAGGFLADRGALLETGPTGTNVNDLRVLLLDED